MTHFLIFGTADDADSYFCEHLAKRILKVCNTVTIDFSVSSEAEYVVKLSQVREKYGLSNLHFYAGTHIVFRDDKLVGDSMALVKIAVDEFHIEDAEFANTIVFNRMVREETAKIMNNPARQYVFLDFADGTGKKSSKTPLFGKVVIELFSDQCPIACNNFFKLCTGEQGIHEATGKLLHFVNCPIHRIVKDGWIQCGDIVDGTGANSISTLPNGELVPDECLACDFSEPIGGMIGYSNSGPHANGSQFFITLGGCSWMNFKYVGIGRVLFGYNALKAINAAPTNNQCPNPAIIVSDCGRQA